MMTELVSQRIWTPRSISASGFGPPFADLDPPTKHSFFPIYSNCKLSGDFNTRSRTIIDEEKCTYRFISVTRTLLRKGRRNSQIYFVAV